MTRTFLVDGITPFCSTCANNMRLVCGNTERNGQRRMGTLTDVHETPCHVWLVNIARSAWRRLSKCVFVPVLSRKLGPVGASYSVRG